jgi:hypothetical protein
MASMLSHSQLSSLTFHAYGSVMSKIGPALAHHKEPQLSGDVTVANESFIDLALNLLYASGEAQRVMYEVAAFSNHESYHPLNYFTKVPGLDTQQQLSHHIRTEYHYARPTLPVSR